MVVAIGAAWSPDRSQLVGSTATPADIRWVFCDAVGLSAADTERLTSLNPTLLIGNAS